MGLDIKTKDKKEKSKYDKRIEIVIALIVISTVIGGTLAWQSFTQRATNETIVNDSLKYEKGGRLHDYYNGETKEVFVENYATKGYGEDVYARIRLDEYYEYGEGAGTTTADTSKITVLRGDKSNIADDKMPSLTKLETWDTYLWEYESDEDVVIRTYRDLAFGGTTAYMPTFNKNYNSLDPELNGTYAGTDGDRATNYDRYGDYVEYEVGDRSEVIEAQYANPEDEHTYLLDSPTFHVAKATLTATVISMNEWMAAPYNSEPGAYWVYDEDGWAYWAQPINPQTATGLLINGITKVEEDVHSEWYYAVNVVAQIATAGDWGDEPEVGGTAGTGMYEGGFTDEAVTLLNKIAGIE